MLLIGILNQLHVHNQILAVSHIANRADACLSAFGTFCVQQKQGLSLKMPPTLLSFARNSSMTNLFISFIIIPIQNYHIQEGIKSFFTDMYNKVPVDS